MNPSHLQALRHVISTALVISLGAGCSGDKSDELGGELNANRRDGGADASAVDGTERPDAASGDAGTGEEAGAVEDGGLDGAASDDASASDDGSVEGDGSVTVDPPLMCAADLADCDLVAANGCEVTLTNNPLHCGACGRSCAAIGATCSADGCSAQPLFTGLPFGTDNRAARTWSFGNGAAYQMGNNNYVVRRYPADGSATSTIWNGTGQTGGTEALLVTSSDVVWAERGSPSTVLKKAHGTSAADLPQVVFTPEYQPQFLRLSGGTYYWASGDYQSGDPAGYLYSRPESAAATVPGTRIVTANQGNHGSIVAFNVSTDALYWVTSSATGGVAYDLRTTPLSGGAPVSLPGGAISAGYATMQATLVTVGNALFFNRNVDTSFLNGIYRYTPGDTAPTQLIAAEDVMTFLVDETSIYFIRQNVGGVWKAARTGGAATKITGQAGTELVGQDATHVYLSQSSCCASTLYRVLK